MPSRAKAFCRYPGCSSPQLAHGYCDAHQSEYQEKEYKRTPEQMRECDRKRGNSNARGYNSRWRKYSKQFLADPRHKFCALRIDERCFRIAQCVDHIDPPDGPDDPKFWDTKNHQPACIHCNSVKGHRNITGAFDIREVLHK